MASGTVKELLKVDWKEIGIKVAGYAAFRARNLSWRTGSSEALAKGLMPDDVAAQAILSVISGERNWDPERGPLLPFLKRVVDSLLNHLAESSDNRRLERLSPDDLETAPQEKVELPIERATRPLMFAAGSLHAEAHQEREDDADQKIRRLFAAADGKPELIEVLRAIVDYEEARPRHIVVRIRKPVSHVNNCLKRLRRLALKLSSDEGVRFSAEQLTHE